MIKGTSNATILTISKSTISQGIEAGPVSDVTTPNAGGAGFGQAGFQEYKESDNGFPGNIFVKSNLHLPLGTAQARYSAV